MLPWYSEFGTALMTGSHADKINKMEKIKDTPRICDYCAGVVYKRFVCQHTNLFSINLGARRVVFPEWRQLSYFFVIFD